MKILWRPNESMRLGTEYTSHQTIDTCKYLPGPGDSPLVTPNSGNHLMTHIFMFVAVFLLELLKSLYFLPQLNFLQISLFCRNL